MSGATGPLELRTLTIVGVDTEMLPGELFVLESAKLTSAAHLIRRMGRVYKGELDLPKSNGSARSRPVSRARRDRLQVEIWARRDVG